jgi:hypothetical protein
LPISDYKNRKRKITVQVDEEVSFEVRGLGLTDVAVIIEVHKPAVEMIYSKVETYRENIPVWNESVVSDITMEFLQASPGLVATIICQAADEWDEVDTVREMPFPVQLAALKAIGILTFRDLAGAKNFLADVKDLIQGFFPMMNQDAAAEDEAREAAQ